MNEKKKDPWTDPDPQPGDFDDVLDEAETVEVEFAPDLEIRIISDEEAARNKAWREAQSAVEAAKP